MLRTKTTGGEMLNQNKLGKTCHKSTSHFKYFVRTNNPTDLK